MRYLAISIIGLLISVSGFTQEYANEMNKLKGNPIYVKLFFKKGLLHESSDWRYLYSFNEYGKVKSQQNFRGRYLISECRYDHDSLKNVIMEECFDYANHRGSPEFFFTEYVYDNKSRIKKETLITRDKIILWVKDSIVYNELNLPIRYSLITPPSCDKGITTIKTVLLTYDDKGRISSIKINDCNGGFKDSYYQYNDDGDISKTEINRVIFTDSSRLVGRTELNYFYKYDKFGNWTKRYATLNNSEKHLELKRVIKYGW